jgi:hypothetical integral membrane protein (TIGR02206 family)
VSQIFALDYRGAAFQLFGAAHLSALACVLALNLGLLRLRNRPQAVRMRARRVLALALVANEIAWHVWNWRTGTWTLQTMLPLHLCSVFVWLGAYLLLTGSPRVYEFAYFLGIAGPLQALITPDAGIYGFPHFRFFQTLIAHGLILTAALFMTLVEGLRPTRRSLVRVLVGMNAYLLLVAGVNALLGSNYLFIAYKPETASIVDFLGPWPWYIVAMEVIGFLNCLVLYVPFEWIDRRRQRVLAPAKI